MYCSVSRPLVLPLSGLTPYKYYIYTMGLYDITQDVYNVVFTGRCIADENGKVYLRIDEVCRDYAWHERRVWEAGRQDYIPADLVSLYSHSLTPVEDGARFIFSSAAVSVYDGDTPVYSNVGTVIWAGREASWMKGEPYVAEGVWCNFATLGNNIVPHLPPLATDNMWLGLVFQWYKDTMPSIGYDIYAVELTLSGEGCYAVSFTMADIFDIASEVNGGDSNSVAEDEIDGGDSSTVADTEVNGGDSREGVILSGTDIKLFVDGEPHVVAHVDECAAPFYVAWTLPSCGWMCFGFCGNTLHGGMPEIHTIVDSMDSEKVISMEQRRQYQLFTNFVTKEEYNLLCTLATAKEVYLYDSERDRGVWCTVESRGTTTAGNVRWQMQPFNLVLNEIVHTRI